MKGRRCDCKAEAGAPLAAAVIPRCHVRALPDCRGNHEDDYCKDEKSALNVMRCDARQRVNIM